MYSESKVDEKQITPETVLNYLTEVDDSQLTDFINQIRDNRELIQRLLTQLDEIYIVDILQEGEVEHLYLVTSLSRVFLILSFICQTPEVDTALHIMFKLFYFIMEHFEENAGYTHFIEVEFEKLTQSENNTTKLTNICWEIASFFKPKKIKYRVDENNAIRKLSSDEEPPSKRQRLDDFKRYLFTEYPSKHDDTITDEETHFGHENYTACK
jgi:hypothetical protein